MEPAAGSDGVTVRPAANVEPHGAVPLIEAPDPLKQPSRDRGSSSQVMLLAGDMNEEQTSMYLTQLRMANSEVAGAGDAEETQPATCTPQQQPQPQTVGAATDNTKAAPPTPPPSPEDLFNNVEAEPKKVVPFADTQRSTST